jgi:hypothetical protein
LINQESWFFCAIMILFPDRQSSIGLCAGDMFLRILP